MWAGLAGCGLCGALGSALGGRFGFSGLGALLGGGIGGFVFSQIATRVALSDIREAVARRNEEKADSERTASP